MTVFAVDAFQQRAARVAGFTLLIGTAVVVFAHFAINQRLVEPADPAQTVLNISAHETLFRINALSYLAYGACVLILATAFYVILRPVNQGLALFAAFFRVVYALTWVLIALNLFGALKLAQRPEYPLIFGPERLHAMVRLQLNAGFEQYYVGLLFWAVGSTAACWLLLRSRCVPKTLAAFGVFAYAWCALSTAIFLIVPGFSRFVSLWWVDSPMGLFEIAVGFWLAFKGLAPTEKVTGISQKVERGAAG